MVGASVFDGVHNTNRGYGIIREYTGEKDGMHSWRVDFESGQKRAYPIQERYLHLALIPHHQRNEPVHPGQRIVVIAGNHKGEEGATKAKVGRTCMPEAVVALTCGFSLCQLPSSPACCLRRATAHDAAS
jgi:hypothetical protein